jgi:Ca-activated chloride channel family protein
VRKPARVLFLLDVSGSMNFPIRPNVTRLQAAKKAIADALSYFNPSDRLGLAAFSNRPNGPITPGLVSPVRPLGSSRQAFLAALHKLKPVAQTPLYAAVDHFVGRMAAGYRPNEINAVVVLSDGHDHGADRTTRMHMLHYLAGVHRKVPILTFTLGYGHQADTGTLQAIATATGAHFFDATNPATVKQVLADELVTSF